MQGFFLFFLPEVLNEEHNVACFLSLEGSFDECDVCSIFSFEIRGAKAPAMGQRLMQFCKCVAAVWKVAYSTLYHSHSSPNPQHTLGPRKLRLLLFVQFKVLKKKGKKRVAHVSMCICEP